MCAGGGAALAAAPPGAAPPGAAPPGAAPPVCGVRSGAERRYGWRLLGVVGGSAGCAWGRRC
ncbi:hypothetical protein FH609_001770 [Streptomyces sp. 3MP-14]|uniref:Uncharacterized protein n=1 Tax=Streptomyces mimosae TaxID=2586635 RepID=A0A5N6AQE6_9ACTN|nr:hypothetical protein FH607_000700 [Streptomyces mimosae]KAB8179748.1 hypothetical protein FH609_001770 [Streptomyces sp. 3MP-14]